MKTCFILSLLMALAFYKCDGCNNDIDSTFKLSVLSAEYLVDILPSKCHGYFSLRGTVTTKAGEIGTIDASIQIKTDECTLGQIVGIQPKHFTLKKDLSGKCSVKIRLPDSIGLPASSISKVDLTAEVTGTSNKCIYKGDTPGTNLNVEIIENKWCR